MSCFSFLNDSQQSSGVARRCIDLQRPVGWNFRFEEIYSSAFRSGLRRGNMATLGPAVCTCASRPGRLAGPPRSCSGRVGFVPKSWDFD